MTEADRQDVWWCSCGQQIDPRTVEDGFGYCSVCKETVVAEREASAIQVSRRIIREKKADG
jgi:hypothetical protein